MIYKKKCFPLSYILDYDLPIEEFGLSMETAFLALYESRRKRRQKLKAEALTDAKQMAALLRKHFEFESLYLYGSILSDTFKPGSDLDLVIKGMRIEDFFKAYALLLKESRFPVDLKPFEDLADGFKAGIQERGMRIG
jgi:predicted nucleotidyltransferase